MSMLVGAAVADEPFDLGHEAWRGKVIFDETKFTKCEASTELQAGTEFAIAQNREQGWSLSLSNEKWHLPEGRSYDLRLEFDHSPGLPAKGVGSSSSRLDIDLGVDRTLIALLRRAHELRITSGTFDEQYSLDGTANVVARLHACTLDRVQAELTEERRSKMASNLGAIFVQTVVWSSPQARLLYPLLTNFTELAASSTPPNISISVGTVTVKATPPAPAPPRPTRRTADAAREAQKRHQVPPPIEPAVDTRIGPFLLPATMPAVIALTGEITPGTTLLFLRALKARPLADTVILDSVGGSVNEGLLLAYEVSDREMTTFVPYEAECLSACAYVFFAGKTRVTDGALGVHQIYGEGVSQSDAQDVLSDVLQALYDFGVPQEVVTAMLRTRPEDIHIFTDREIALLELNRGMLDRAALFAHVADAPVTVRREKKAVGPEAATTLDLGF